jgi:uncharacterized membrane protein
MAPRILSFIVLCLWLLSLSCESQPRYPRAPFDGDRVAIATETLRHLAPEFYTAAVDGKSVNFFVMMKDGEVLSFFDACRECYSKKLGFLVDDGHIMCRACKVRYPIDQFMKGIGNCYPIKLEGSMNSGRYMITMDALRKGVELF